MDNLPSFQELLAVKSDSPGTARQVIHQAADWLDAKLAESGEEYEYHTCEHDYYAYAMIEIRREIRGNPLALEVKIAEINGGPYAFANVHTLGEPYHPHFPLFNEIQTSAGRELLLHYVTDFLLSAG